MANFDYDLGIIGGGAAGLTVASGAAQLGASVLLTEREPALGGDCLHFGCVPSKTLIRSARVCQQIREAERYGLPPVLPGPVDFSAVAARIREVIAAIQHHDSVERFTGLGAQVRFGESVFRDEHTVEIDGKAVTAARWVVVTGSSPAVPPIPGLAEAGALTNREIFSLQELPETLLVLGGGPIAIEMSQAFRRLGSRVIVVEKGSQILNKEDADLAALVQAALEREGVVFHLEATVLQVGSENGLKKVVIETGSGRRELFGSHLLAALGRRPNIDGLGLEQAGVACSRGGIEVDSRLRTSRKHIFAAGDVIGGYQFTHAAGYEGGVVLTNAVLRLPRKVDYTWMPWCTYSDPELASIGYNEKRAREEGLDFQVHQESFGDNDRARAEGAVDGTLKLILTRREKPLGVQVCGPHAGELLGEWVAALNGGVGFSKLAGAIHPYPTLVELNKRAVGSVLSRHLFSDKVRKVLKLLFRYRGD